MGEECSPPTALSNVKRISPAFSPRALLGPLTQPEPLTASTAPRQEGSAGGPCSPQRLGPAPLTRRALGTHPTTAGQDAWGQGPVRVSCCVFHFRFPSEPVPAESPQEKTF